MSFENPFRPNNFESADKKDRQQTVNMILQEPEVRPQLERFAEDYGADAVKKDIETVNHLRAQFARKDQEHPEALVGKRFSAAFERVFKSWAGRLNWFGEKSEVMSASEYDDYVNGVDGILVLRGSEYVSLAIDTTHAGTEKIKEKLVRAFERMTDPSQKHVVKYFERKNYRGRLLDSIPVVIGLDDHDADDIIDTFGHILRILKQKERTPRQKEILAEKVESLKKHPAQSVFLEEIRLQLALYRDTLEKSNNEELASRKTHVKDVLQIIEEIATEKSRFGMRELANDQALGTIRAFCQSQK